MTLDSGHGRIEWRGIEVKATTPAQMGFPHAAQVARVDRIRELKNGKQEVETVWIITSLTVEEITPERLLALVRLYWSIENGTHHPLDVSAGRMPVGSAIRSRRPSWASCAGPRRESTGPGPATSPAKEIEPSPPSEI